MNKLTVSTLLLLCVLFASAKAQQPAAQGSAAPRPVLPSGPLLNRAPEMAQWTVTFKATGALSAGKPKPGEKPQVDTSDSAIVVTKTKSIYHIQTVNGAGFRTDKWCIDNVQVTTLPNAESPVLSTPDNKGPYDMDFSQHDFAGFDWISASNFADIRKVSGRDCLVFRDRIKASESSSLGMEEGSAPPATAEAEAVIDEASRLPIMLKVGESVTTYQYGSAPSAMQVPPPNIMSIVQEWRGRVQRASMMPPP